MSDIMHLKVKVKSIMSSPAITAKADDKVSDIAKIMDLHDIGSVIITDAEGKPIGIITDMDIIKRVIARNLNPYEVKAKDAMSQPLITVDPDTDITDAAKLMSFYHVKRLGVVYKGKLVGVVSSKDVTAVMPELLEIVYEKARIEGFSAVPGHEEVAVGYCEGCGQWSDLLTYRNGKFLCKDCLE